jgi:NAD(P)H-dependent flavin oxidoreductase YrpB (nitropropane dioxygenase family)
VIGHPKHVKKCLDLGVDLICAQGGEGGGHTGDVPTSILIPTVAKLCAGHKSPMTGQPVQVVAAGGLYNGQGLAAALMLGASAVWIGTRFVLSEEAGAPKAHQEAVRTSGFDDNVRTIIFTGRPLRVRKNEYIANWEENRQAEMKTLTEKGTIPVEHDFETMGDGEFMPLLPTFYFNHSLEFLLIGYCNRHDRRANGQRAPLPNGQSRSGGQREEERERDRRRVRQWRCGGHAEGECDYREQVKAIVVGRRDEI